MEKNENQLFRVKLFASNRRAIHALVYLVFCIGLNGLFGALVYRYAWHQNSLEQWPFIVSILAVNAALFLAYRANRRPVLDSTWVFFTALIVLNTMFFLAVYGIERYESLLDYCSLVAAALMLNGFLLWAHLHEGRRALKRIPSISATVAVLTALAAVSLTREAHSFGFLETIYRIAQLFVGESQWVDNVLQGISDAETRQEFIGENTFTLLFNVARLTALIATVSGVLALVRQLVDRLKVYSLRGKEQVVLCGLGEAGLEMVRKWHENNDGHRNANGERLLVVERDPSNPNVEIARDLGFGVIIGDVFDPQVQKKAYISRASSVVLLLRDDKWNIELALELRSWIKARRCRKPSPLRRFAARLEFYCQEKCPESKRSLTFLQRLSGSKRPTTKLLVHVDDTALAQRLQDHSRAGAEEYTETRFFDFYESSARALFQEHPLDKYAEIQDTSIVHVAIYGFGKMGDAVLRQAIRLAPYPGYQALHVSVFDARVNDDGLRATIDGFDQANPGIKHLEEGNNEYIPFQFSLSFHKLSDARCGIEEDYLEEEIPDHIPPPSQHIVCFDEDELSASFAMMLRDALRTMKACKRGNRFFAWDAPVFVRLKRRHGLARLFLETEREGNTNREGKLLHETPDSLFAFGMLDDIVDPKQLFEDQRDTRAQVLHEDGYRKLRGLIPSVVNIWRKQSGVEWAKLPLHFKGSNRAQADHMEVKLRSVGCLVAEPSLLPFDQIVLGSKKAGSTLVGSKDVVAAEEQKAMQLRGGGCFEPIDLISVQGDKLITVQRRLTKMPIINCWKIPWQINQSSGTKESSKQEELPSLLWQTPHDPDRVDSKTDDWSSLIGKQPKWLKSVQQDIKKTAESYALPPLLGERDPLVNHDKSNKIDLKADKKQDKFKGSGYVLEMHRREKLVGTLTSNIETNLDVEEVVEIGNWLATIVSVDDNKVKPEHQKERHLLVWNIGKSKDPIRLPESIRKNGSKLPGSSEDGQARRAWKLLLASSEKESKLALCLIETQQRFEEKKWSDTAAQVLLAIADASSQELRYLEVPSDKAIFADITCFQFDRNGQQLIIAANDPQKEEEEKKGIVHSTVTSIKLPTECGIQPGDSDITRIKPELPARLGSIEVIERIRSDDGVIHWFCGTSSYKVLVLSESGNFKKIDVHFHSKPRVLYFVPGAAAGSNRPPKSGGQLDDCLFIGCDNSEVLMVSLSSENGLRYFSHSWLVHLRQTPIPTGRFQELTVSDAWEELAKGEHDRWAAYHYLNNWRFGQSRVDAARLHNNLTGWEKLKASDQQYDSGHIAKFPLFIERLNKKRAKSKGLENRQTSAAKLCCEIRIGIVGHRPNRLKGPLNWLNAKNKGKVGNEALLPSGEAVNEKRIQTIVQKLQKLFQPGPNDLPVKFTLVTPLAEGSDRVLAEALMQREMGLNCDLEVVLPLPWEIYYNTFSDGPDPNIRAESVKQFMNLTARAKHYQLPLKFGTIAEVAVNKHESLPNPQQEQFQLANAYIVQSCDFLIAAWDGREIQPLQTGESETKELCTIEGLPDGTAASPYTEASQPGGTWEALRWWLLPDSIPDTMRRGRSRAHASWNGSPERKDRLLWLGPDVTLDGIKGTDLE